MANERQLKNYGNTQVQTKGSQTPETNQITSEETVIENTNLEQQEAIQETANETAQEAGQEM